MHILNVTTATLDDLVEPVDLRQRPAAVVAVSFSDSDLGGLAGRGSARGAGGCGSALRTPGTRCRSISGSSRWRPGRGRWWCGSRPATTGGPMAATGWRAVAREAGSRWRCCRGEDREADARLTALSTVPGAERGAARLLPRGRAGEHGGLLRRLAGHDVAAPVARAVPRAALWLGGRVLPLTEAGPVDRAVGPTTAPGHPGGRVGAPGAPVPGDAGAGEVWAAGTEARAAERMAGTAGGPRRGFARRRAGGADPVLSLDASRQRLRAGEALTAALERGGDRGDAGVHAEPARRGGDRRGGGGARGGCGRRRW